MCFLSIFHLFFTSKSLWGGDSKRVYFLPLLKKKFFAWWGAIIETTFDLIKQ